jgi:hypothetical protein
MPQANDLFDLVEAKRFAEALTLLQDNSGFVNAIDEANQSLLQSCVFYLKPGDASQAFIEYIVTHPELDFGFKVEENDTNQEALIGSGRADLIEKLLDKKEFLFIGAEPTYLTAQKRLQSISKSTIQTHARKNPGSPPLDPMTNPRVANIAQIVSKIREATLRYAVEQDDADLIIKLQTADNNVADYQAGGVLNLFITSLVKPEQMKINGWLVGTYPPKAPAGAGRSPHGLYASIAELDNLLSKRPVDELAELARLEKQLEDAKTAQDAAYTAGIEHGTTVLAQMQAVVNEDYSPIRP